MDGMANYYMGVEQAPYHLSVGSVLRNGRGEIACHHFDEAAGMSDVYILMRETIEPGETLEETIHRGLMEEFGAKARIVGYLGSIVAQLDNSGPPIQKTTLYFVCDLNEIHEGWRKPDDEEKGSVIEWHDVDFLIDKMSVQGERYRRQDFDESAVLRRLASFAC